jgi:hypothetical protein
MHLLRAHLREPEDHGRLTFNADCPICRRERLVGVLPLAPIVSRRTQALIASGVLAFSAAAPSAALAAEPDQEQEGSVAPDQVAPGDPADSPDSDPGGTSTDLPFEDQSGPAQPSPDPAGDEAGPLEAEPDTDQSAPIIDAGDEAAGPTSQEQVAALGQSDLPPQPSEPTATPSEPALNVTAPQSPAAAPSPPLRNRRAQARKPSPRTVVPRKHELNKPSPLTASAGTAAVTAQPAPTPPVRAVTDRVHPGDRSHVVETGESLWSIADDLLGGDASPARIAREVHKLWELNKKRIGTGDPDLLMVGTRLRLR